MRVGFCFSVVIQRWTLQNRNNFQKNQKINNFRNFWKNLIFWFFSKLFQFFCVFQISKKHSKHKKLHFFQCLTLIIYSHTPKKRLRRRSLIKMRPSRSGRDFVGWQKFASVYDWEKSESAEECGEWWVWRYVRGWVFKFWYRFALFFLVCSLSE